MANRTSKKYYINHIPNTYYAVYEEVSGLFNTQIKKDHAFYINGKYHGLGFYDFEKFKLHTSFVEFLNSRLSEKIDFYLEIIRMEFDKVFKVSFSDIINNNPQCIRDEDIIFDVNKRNFVNLMITFCIC